MADIRFDNMFWSPGGFNIQSGEPIDSRMYVADINHIYSAENWKKVKPYPGLIVSAPDGEVRICVNADYTLKSSWKKIGGGAVSVATYAEAVALATQDNIGQVIYVSTSSEYDPDGDGGEDPKTYAAALYIVTGNGTLMKLAASSASGDVTSDIAGLQSRVTNLEGNIERIDGVLETKANTSDVTNSISNLRTEIGNTYLTKDTATSTYLSKNEASSTYVTKTDYDTKVEEIGTTTNGLRTDVDALKSAVGSEASGETLATGLFKDIDDLRKDITAIPKFAIEVVESLPEDNISGTTVYLVKEKDSVGDLYTEYIYVNGAWENLGKQTVDLSSYSTTEQMNAAISAAITTKIAGYYTKGEVDTKLADKADARLLDNYVLTTKLESDYLTKTQVETELRKKADASALNAYVTSETFNTELEKKADKTLLDNYVAKTTYEANQQAVNNAIANKADKTALDAYLKIADIDTTLNAYVKQDSLNTQLEAYVKTDVLTTKLGDYVLKTSLSGSSSISLVESGVYEVNAISAEELNTIINSKASE